MRAQPCHVVEPLAQQGGRAQHAGQGRQTVAETRRVQHRGHPGAGFGVLVRHQIEQGAGPHERHTGADRATLVLQGHLRPAQGVDAGCQPAGKRQHPIGGTRGQDQVRVRNRRADAVAQDVQRLALDVPDQAARTVLHLWQQTVHGAMHGIGLAMLKAIQSRFWAGESGRWLPVDLPAGAQPFVQDHGPQSLRGQRLRGAHAGGPRTDDHRHHPAHGASSSGQAAAASEPGVDAGASGTLCRRMPGSM
ncbi:hypothetical protein D3C72_1259290 [compost metagenome]